MVVNMVVIGVCQTPPTDQSQDCASHEAPETAAYETPDRRHAVAAGTGGQDSIGKGSAGGDEIKRRQGPAALDL